MFNLLPKNLKEKIKTEYKLRKITVILIFIICLQLSFLIFLTPSWLISFYKEKEVTSQSEEIKKHLSDSSLSEVIVTIRGINTKLNIINSVLKYPKIVPFINTILSKKTSSIKIDELAYILGQENTAEIIIGGTSLTREALVSFVKALEDSKSFNKVNLPISNLAKDKNISFSISLQIIQESNAKTKVIQKNTLDTGITYFGYFYCLLFSLEGYQIKK